MTENYTPEVLNLFIHLSADMATSNRMSEEGVGVRDALADYFYGLLKIFLSPRQQLLHTWNTKKRSYNILPVPT